MLLPHCSKPALAFALIGTLAACGGEDGGAEGSGAGASASSSNNSSGAGGSGTGGSSSSGNAGGSSSVGGATGAGGGGQTVCEPPSGLSRGVAWVRDNPMFISGLTPTVGTPTVGDVAEYFDGFAANSVHLWQDGLPTELNGWAAAGQSDFRFFSWVGDSGASTANQQIIGGIAANAPGRIGYQIGDEPVGLAALMGAETGVDAVRAADPDALIAINFSTSQPSASELTQMLGYLSSMDVDVYSYDLYTYTRGAYGALELIRGAALADGRAYWRYLKSYSDVSDWPSDNDMLWDAMIGLVYGYTGHTWFIYQITHPGLNPAFFNGINGGYGAAKTERWQVAADINRKLANYGRSITQLFSTDVRYVPTSSFTQPDGTTNWSPGAGGNAYLSSVSAVENLQEILLGFFDDACGDHYVMLQNPNHSAGNFPTVIDTPGTFRLGFDFGSVTDPDYDTSTIEFINDDTGAVETMALDGNAFEVVLDPGEVFLFKHKTGNAFVTQ